MKNPPAHRLARLGTLASAIVSLLAASSAHATSDSWAVDGAGNWDAVSNWLSTSQAPGDVAIDNTDVATFGFSLTGDAAVTVDATRYIGGISFGNPSAFKYTLDTGILNLNSGGVVQTLATNGSHTDTISSPIVISGTTTATAVFTAGATSATSLLSLGAVTGSATADTTTSLTLNGTNTGSNAVTGIIGDGAGGALSLTKASAGTWMLSGANTFTGQLTVEQGILKVDSLNDSAADGVLGNSANSVILGKTGSITGTLAYTGATATSSKKFTMATGGMGAFQVDSAGTILTLSGVMNGSGALTKTGAGNLTLTGTGSSIGGLTTVSAGTLEMTNGTLTSIGLTLSGGSSTISGATTVWTNTGASADLLVGTTTGGNTLVISGGAVVKPTQDRYLSIGSSITSDANIVTVTGVGSALGATGNVPGLYLGRAANNSAGGDNNEVRVLAGGTLTTGASGSRRSIIGTGNGTTNISTGNKVTVDGSGSAWTIATANLYIAANTNDSTNGVLVSNGGVVNMVGQQYVLIGGAATASANYITVTGAGSVWNMSTAQLNIGNAGTNATFGLAGTQTGFNNTLTVSSGGVVSNLKWLMVGNSSAASTGNSALVESGGLLEINTAIAVGHVSNTTATDNTLTVNTGGILQLKAAAPTITIGAGSGNAITVDGGTLSYKTVTGADMSANQTAGVGVGQFTWSGLNTFRLDGTVSNTTDTGATAYTFANNLGATNYKTLELLGTTGITRAITLDGGNGGALMLRGATSTVTGGISLTGAVHITAAGTASTLTGVVGSSGALTKLGSATLTLASTPSYSGDTTVSEGTLKLTSANASNESSTVTLATTGAALELAFVGTDTVDKLFIGTTEMGAGIYGATGSGATTIDDTHFAGAGTLTVSSGVGSSNYASWANDPAKGNIPGEPASGDFDNDGLSNITEYALGKNPRTSSQPAGDLSSNVITFTKGADAIANGDVSWVIETSTTLAAGSWTPQVTQAPGDPAATISYSFTPGSPAANFARLKITQN